jgi:hypothetical protein
MAVNIIRTEQRFKYQPIRHEHALAVGYVEERVAFCHKMLRLRDDIPVMYFSDESRFVLGDDY